MSSENNNDDEKKTLLVLISKGVSDRTQASNQSKALTMLKAHDTPYETIDGMDPHQRETRDALFKTSGIRGSYPQFFFANKSGTMTYFGNFEKIENINELSSLPDDVLKDNPEVETWDRVFSNIVEKFD